jgi:hypothetical protein
MINRFIMLFNQIRQAVITGGQVEIIIVATASEDSLSLPGAFRFPVQDVSVTPLNSILLLISFWEKGNQKSTRFSDHGEKSIA